MSLSLWNSVERVQSAKFVDPWISNFIAKDIFAAAWARLVNNEAWRETPREEDGIFRRRVLIKEREISTVAPGAESPYGQPKNARRN
jgi:hypothetical protein